MIRTEAARIARRQTERFAAIFRAALGMVGAALCCTLLSHAASLVARADNAAPRHFAIRVVDDETGRGVPLIELRTVNQLRYFTDSAGYVAFFEPGLMDSKVYFAVSGHGYEAAADGFGFRGRAFDVRPGGEAEIKVRRVNLAERLYRVTGSGIYADSQMLGRAPPHATPPLVARVFGSDSVVNAIYRGRLHWFWGDTNRPEYPLGNFHVPGATSHLPTDGGINPADGVTLDYFLDDKGRAAETARMPGDGPTWINGLIALPDATGRERLLATYMKVKPPLTIYERGFAQFNDETQRFERVDRYPIDAPLAPHGHPFRRRDGDREYVYFGDPFPWMRAPAIREGYCDLAQYEGYSALAPNSTPAAPQLDRDDSGKLRFAWRRAVAPWSVELEERLARDGLLRAGEGLLDLREARSPSSREQAAGARAAGANDREKGQTKRIVPHRGSIAWNAFRQRWITVFVQTGGDRSLLGEVWFAEADVLEGPWRNAVKIATHEQYSFYNPKLHPYFDQQDGRVVYFEGTYTHTFSGSRDPTPRYDYNQVMYRLDLSRLPARAP